MKDLDGISKEIKKTSKIIKLNENDQDVSLIFGYKDLTNIIFNKYGIRRDYGFKKDVNFILDESQIIQLYYIIREKIQETSGYKLYYLTIIVHSKYKENGDILNTREVYKSIEEFEARIDDEYKEPVLIELKFNTLIKFNNSEGVEHQYINILFDKDESQKNKISVEIDSTNASWGSNIKNAIKNRLAYFMKNDENKYLLFFVKNLISRETLLIITCIHLFFLLFILVYSDDSFFSKINWIFEENPTMINQISEKEILLIKELNIKNVIKFIENKDEKIAKILEKRELEIDIRKKSFFVYFLGLLGLAFLMLLLLFFRKKIISFYESKSFILITKAEKDRYDIYKKNKELGRQYGIFSIVFIIFTGILINSISSILF